MSIRSIVNRVVPTIFEDADFLIVDKPAGVDTGGRKDDESIGLAELLTMVRQDQVELHPVNRLSRFESGVLLLAKNERALEPARKLLRTGRMAQTYLAVVHGRLTRSNVRIGGEPAAPRGRAKRSGDTAVKTKPAKSQRTESAGVTSISRVREGDRVSLVRCETASPTTHALRAQLRSADLRLEVDPRAGASYTAAPVEQTLLHLQELSVQLPDRKAPLIARTAMPRDVDCALSRVNDVNRLLRASLARRLPLLVHWQTDAMRLLTGPAEYLPELIVERLGEAIVFQVLEDNESLMTSLRRIAVYYRDLLQAKAVYVKRFVKDRASADPQLRESLYSATPLLGTAVAPQIEVRERDMVFGVRPYDGFNVGLFPDQRDNRARIRCLAAGQDVLNLFAYTCGFSVAAALGGATRTTSVDLAPRNLEWGKANFRLNHLNPDDHEFVAADALDYANRAAKHERAFDIIVADAPTFAHGRKAGKDFAIERDMPKLVAALQAVLRSDGLLMLSTNNRKLSLRAIKERIKTGAGRRKFQIIDVPELPLDYAVDRAHAKTLFVRFS